MTAHEAIIRELVAKVETARASVAACNRSIENAMTFRMGRGAADYRVSLYYAECELEGAQQDLADELYDEARAMDLEAAA
jgi:hypothetical protein